MGAIQFGDGKHIPLHEAGLYARSQCQVSRSCSIARVVFHLEDRLISARCATSLLIADRCW